MNFEIIELTREHEQAISEIENAVFSVPFQREQIKFSLNDKKHKKLFGVLFEDKLVGYIEMQEILGEAEVNRMAVLSSFRGKQLGKELLARGLEFAKERNCKVCFLEVRKNNRVARNLYESFGFEPVGERKDYYTLPTDDAIIYKKILR